MWSTGTAARDGIPNLASLILSRGAMRILSRGAMRGACEVGTGPQLWTRGRCGRWRALARRCDDLMCTCMARVLGSSTTHWRLARGSCPPPPRAHTALPAHGSEGCFDHSWTTTVHAVADGEKSKVGPRSTHREKCEADVSGVSPRPGVLFTGFVHSEIRRGEQTQSGKCALEPCAWCAVWAGGEAASIHPPAPGWARRDASS